MKTAKHTLLLDDQKNIQQNRISAKSDLNTYRFKNKLISRIEERASALSYIESFFLNDNDDFDSTKYSKAKYKFKKWIQSKNTPDTEKILFKKLLKVTDDHQDKRISADKAIQVLLSNEYKVKRLNDKRKAITTLIELHNERINKDIDHSSQLNIRLIEVLFKVPKHNNEPISAKKQEEVLRRYYLDVFPEFELFLTVIHNDEAVPHVHGFIDGLNKKTKQCDFVQKQYEFIKSKFNLTNFPENYSQCEKTQIKQVGEFLQKDFYDYTNTLLLEQGIYTEFAKKDLTDEEKELRRVIKTDNAKPIAEREYNTANYLAEINKKQYQKNNELKSEYEELESNFNTLKLTIKSAIGNALTYAKSAYKLALSKYHLDYKNIKSIDESLAEEIENISIEIQPSEEKKQAIKSNFIKFD